jgi:hypothetical protein
MGSSTASSEPIGNEQQVVDYVVRMVKTPVQTLSSARFS